MIQHTVSKFCLDILVLIFFSVFSFLFFFLNSASIVTVLYHVVISMHAATVFLCPQISCSNN